MKPMSFSETIFLFFLALVIFGPKKLPEIARTVGKALNEFKRASNEFKAQIEQEIAHLEVEKQQTVLPPSPTPEGTTSRTLNASPVQSTASETPATPSASDDEPLFAAGMPELAPATSEAASAADTVASPTSQESHA
jgi:sec-independent protein translocase protein TatB